MSMSVTTSIKQMRLTGFVKRIQDLHQSPWNELHVCWLRACKRIASGKAPPHANKHTWQQGGEIATSRDEGIIFAVPWLAKTRTRKSEHFYNFCARRMHHPAVRCSVQDGPAPLQEHKWNRAAEQPGAQEVGAARHTRQGVHSYQHVRSTCNRLSQLSHLPRRLPEVVIPWIRLEVSMESWVRNQLALPPPFPGPWLCRSIHRCIRGELG